MAKLVLVVLTIVMAGALITACGMPPLPQGKATGLGGGAQANAGSQASAGTHAGDPAKGRQNFAGTCSSCHGADAKGLPGLGKNLTTSTFVHGLNDAQLLDFVKKGRPASDPANTTKVDMPPRGGNPALKDSDLVDIIAFIRTINK